jgi:hypothetical protein
MKENETDGTCSTHREVTNTYTILFKNLKRRDHLGDLDVDAEMGCEGADGLKTSGTIKGGGYIYQLSDYQFLKKGMDIFLTTFKKITTCSRSIRNVTISYLLCVFLSLLCRQIVQSLKTASVSLYGFTCHCFTIVYGFMVCLTTVYQLH